MGTIRTAVIVAAGGLFGASPAYAADSFVLPDPSGITLFAVGVVGLVVGRHIAKKRKD